MSRVEIEPSRRYYCEVIGAPDPLAGTFVIEDQDVRASLVRFDAFLPYEDEGSLHVRTEGNWYASMFDLVPSGWSQTGGETTRSYVRNTSSNVTLVGWDVWTDADLVRRLTFRIPGLQNLFEGSPHFRSVIDSEFAELPDLTAFEIEVAGVSLKAWLAPAGNLSSGRPRHVVPWIVIEYAEGRPLTELRRAIPLVVRFFSTLSGKNLQAAEIVVSRHSEDDVHLRAEARQATPEHRVFRYADGGSKSDDRADPYSTLVSLRSASDRNSLETSLAAWIARDPDWAPATAMMADTLAKQGVMSASRLLSATRCLEEIPGAGPEDVINRDHARALGKLVGRAAARLGYGAIGGRFRNAISRIALETNRQRLGRLVGEVRAAFGSAVVDEYIVDWVAEALSMRGRAAHGARTALDDEYEVFARAVEAVECLNFLLMSKDLPLGNEHRARVSRHPLVERYRNCTLPGSPATFRSGLFAAAQIED